MLADLPLPGNVAVFVASALVVWLAGTRVARDADREGPALAETGPFATFAALLGIAVSALFLAGLLERGHRMIFRMGIDSILVLLTYAGGVAILYRLR